MRTNLTNVKFFKTGGKFYNGRDFADSNTEFYCPSIV
jgi:hypothetical protein